MGKGSREKKALSLFHLSPFTLSFLHPSAFILALQVWQTFFLRSSEIKGTRLPTRTKSRFAESCSASNVSNSLPPALPPSTKSQQNLSVGVFCFRVSKRMGAG